MVAGGGLRVEVLRGIVRAGTVAGCFAVGGVAAGGGLDCLVEEGVYACAQLFGCALGLMCQF